MPPVSEAWQAGGFGILLGLLITVGTVVACLMTWSSIKHLTRYRYWIIAGIIVLGYILLRLFFDPGVDAIEAIDPSVTGYLGGLGLPIVVAWPVGALFAAGVAFVIGKIALGLAIRLFWPLQNAWDQRNHHFLYQKRRMVDPEG